MVPAQASDWQVDPFAGEIKDGCGWGRGAVDMKDFDAMVLSVVRDRQRTGRAPRRPIRLIFTADEEAGSGVGAHWLVENRPDLIDAAGLEDLLQCPLCGDHLSHNEQGFECLGCKKYYPVEDGIIDLRVCGPSS